jgi:DNA transposition AAA+ family ATPase
MAHAKPVLDRQYNEVRDELQRYMSRTGLTAGDIARRINYSSVSLHFFIQGRYQGNPAHICTALHDFMGQHPIAPATEIEGKLYETANVRTLRRIFYECLDKQRAGVVYGGPGSQKTFGLEHLIAELNCQELAKDERRAYCVYCRQGIRPRQLLKRIAKACGSSAVGDTDRVLDNLLFDFGKRKIVIVFDEAQHLDVDCLETVRELLDRLKCGLLFAGSHDLIRTFKRSIELEQWNSRLRTAEELPGITDNEALSIVREELGDINERKQAMLLKAARVPDIRSKSEYISARRLFFGLAAIHEHAERSRVQ